MVSNPKNTLAQGVAYFSQILDVVGVSLISYTVHGVYLKNWDLSFPYLVAIILTALMVFAFFQNFGVYQSWRGRSKFRRTRVITVAWGLIALLLVIASALLKNTTHYSRVWFTVWFILSLFYLNLYRLLLDIFLSISRRKGWNQKDIIIFGAGDLGDSVGARILDSDWVGFNIKAYFDDDKEKLGKRVNHVEVRDPDELGDFILKNDIKELWIALPFSCEDRIKTIIHEIRHISISIKFIPDIFGFRLLNQSFSEVAGIPIVQINGTPMQGVNRLIKELEDRVLSLIILIFISPVLIIIAIAIKLDSKGPVLFKQVRNGWDGREIKVYKFRSMIIDAEANGYKQATKNDSRVTKIGKFIRKTSLDELPQFFNVLQGRMSIVGPRPHVISQNEEYKDQVEYYMQRHRVKPGITGWAQVNGFRGETDTLNKMSKRIEYDLYYIENWSFWFDIKIIFLTIFKGFVNKNAY